MYISNNWLLYAMALITVFILSAHPSKASNQTEKKTFILIHGSWHSAWNWYKVTPLLEKEGHEVFAIDLPGMGRDKTPIQDVKFESTVLEICKLIDEIPGKVILVGHSKNGIMISQVAEYRPEKVEKLIYLAAVLIPNGKSAKDYFKLDKDEWLGSHISFDESTQSTTLNPEIYKEGLYHDCPDEITEMAKILLSSEPIESAVVSLQLTDENYGSVPRYYIECTEDRAITPFLQRKMYTEMPCKEVFRMATSHSPFFSKPQELADIFLEISAIQEIDISDEK